jgi:acyl-coenzyme A synthetase/AMP-(fatty) acid ligase
MIHGRSDAVLNPGGVRIGTAEIYRQVEKVPQVLEAWPSAAMAGRCARGAVRALRKA